MKTAAFEYNLPEELIANSAPPKRGSTRLMLLNRANKIIEHRAYADIPDYVQKGDVLVLNKTKVIKARVKGVVQRNGRKVECLFLKPRQELHGWEALIGYARYVKIGDQINLTEKSAGSIKVIGREKGSDAFIVQAEGISHDDLFDKYGEVPLPAYIKRNATKEDEERYNTIFAKNKGSVAAPTASLNLTDKILREIELKGCKIVYVDLTVGWGTFAPVRVENIEEHKIHSEHFSISEESANVINQAIINGGKVWAFGTTVTRVLESVAYKSSDDSNPDSHFLVAAKEGETDIFIYPGYQFKIVNHLVTNLHAPKSSLIMLVSAFAGHQFIMSAYQEAIDKEYKFLSYGDSMLII